MTYTTETSYEIEEHYDGTVRIKFYPKSHRYQIEGRKNFLLSPSAVTGIIDKSTPLIIWATNLAKEYLRQAIINGEPITDELLTEAMQQYRIKKEAAADTGTDVHEWIHQYVTHQNPEIPKDPQVRNGILGFLKFINKHKVEFIHSEKRVYSMKHSYVGTFDVLFQMDGKTHIGDWKTSKRIYPEFWLQVAAYKAAYLEEFGGELHENYLFHFDKETGEFDAQKRELAYDTEDFQAFLALLKAKQWLKKHTR
nr:MAG: exonuclease V a 5' deoxyribonuclease [Podoviridae sp. ctka020]